MAGSVRFRTTGAAVVVVGVALVVGAVMLVATLRSQLADQVRTSAQLRARDVAAALDSGTPATELAVSDDEDFLIQVVAADGTVVASSQNVVGEPAVADLQPGQSRTLTNVAIEDDHQNFVAVAAGVNVDGRELVVLVARANGLVESSTRLLTVLLTAGIPLLLVIVGITVWWLTGRALSPVEAMRAEVDEISASELHRRVPHPPGTDEIARLATTMNRMLARLDQAQATQQRFIADASHELRSPVATIRQHAEVALAHPDRTSTRDLAETVLAEDLRVQRLVEDLLLLARMEEPTPSQRRHAVDLDDLLLEEAERVRATTPLRVDLSALSAGQVAGDAPQLRRLVRNLVDNAVRHAAGTIHLSLATVGGVVVLVVEDDGTGVPVEQRERIFDRFVRLDDARDRDAGGSGLGLAIVRDIANRHGGQVRIDGEAAGARFEVRLPALADDRLLPDRDRPGL